MKAVSDIRPSPIAGRWYLANAGDLAREVDSYIDAARLPEIPGEIVAVMAPHAGHRYSGPVAGYAFAALRGRSPDLVEDQITYPLVRALQRTPGIATVRGYSMFGMSFTYATKMLMHGMAVFFIPTLSLSKLIIR